MNTTFGIGNVLATGFRIWFKNFVPFMLITALICSPVLIWIGSSAIGEITTQERLEALINSLRYGGMLMHLLNIVVSSALTYGVVMELQGQRASIGSCITTGIARFFPTLGVALLFALCVIGGLFLLVIPGLIMLCMLYVAPQCAVLERPGVFGSLKRSRELTSGHKFELFGLVFILFLLNFALEYAVKKITLDEASNNVTAYVFTLLGEQMVTTSLGATMASVAYFMLRLEKEGTSAEELAKIFD
jgi:hypothetical protein